MTTYYADWSMRNGWTYITEQDEYPKPAITAPTHAGLLDANPRGSTLVCEGTAMSFVAGDLEIFLGMCDAHAVTLKFTATRETGRMLRELNYTKGDTVDPYAIRQIARRGGHLRLAVPRPTADTPHVIARKAANRELMLLRQSGNKDAFANAIIASLPDYSDLSPSQRLALGNGKKYSATLVAAVGTAVKHSSTRDEFEQLCGLYAHGYPSQIRADIYHWNYAGGAARARLTEDKADWPDGFGLRKRKDGLTLSEFRRSIRNLRSMILASGTFNPA